MPVHGCSWPYMVIVAHVSCADVTPGPKRRPRRTAQSARSASPEAGSPPRVPHTATSSSTFTPSATAATAVSPDTSARTRLWPPTRPPTSTRSTFGTQEGVMRLASPRKHPANRPVAEPSDGLEPSTPSLPCPGRRFWLTRVCRIHCRYGTCGFQVQWSARLSCGLRFPTSFHTGRLSSPLQSPLTPVLMHL
jgi:hypothetical protein